MTRSIHDNHVLGYSVDSERVEILIRTEFRGKGPPFERTDIRFHGVLGFLLLDSVGGVLFDVDELEIDQVLREYGQFFARGVRYGWPGVWNSSDTAVASHVASQGAKVWRIQSSIGFDGFVIGQAMSVVAAEEPIPGRSGDI